MFHIELTPTEKATLETALNHLIGELLAHVGRLTVAHGAASQIVAKATTEATRAQYLYERIAAAPFKILDPHNG